MSKRESAEQRAKRLRLALLARWSDGQTTRRLLSSDLGHFVRAEREATLEPVWELVKGLDDQTGPAEGYERRVMAIRARVASALGRKKR